MNAVVRQESSSATVYKNLIAAKGSPLTRGAYADDLIPFATFLGITSVSNEHPLASVPDTAWRELDTGHVKAYLEHLRTMTSERTGQLYSTATIARRMTAVMELLAEATYTGVFERSKLEYLKARLKPPKVTNQHHAGITADEQARLLKCADEQPGLKGLRDYALFRLLLDTGLRRAELAALKVADLIMKDGIPVLIVRRGKGNKLREIGLESYTAHVLRLWIGDSGQAAHPDWPMFCQVRRAGRGSVARYKAAYPRNHLSGIAVYKLVMWYAAQAGIESEISPHSFRVAMATDMLDGGASMQHVMAVGGWTTSRMPEQVYNRKSYREPVARYRRAILPRRNANGKSGG
ncbi:MAG: hypothetical protein A2Z03_04125 [Chloroflexi bacterium RBG_16_56_8]|nr:MAG: hypothetical protein A2Z03_04125 [Chloroflexi bacterium RBG_16_56_8]